MVVVRSLFTFTSVIIMIIIIINSHKVVIGRMTELDKNDVDLDSLEAHLEEEQEENYKEIPLKNMRQIRISSLHELSSELKKQAVQYYQALLDVDAVVTNAWLKLFTDNDPQKKKEMKLELLGRGLWAECGWVNKMPPPFDKDDHDQCSEPELQYLLDNSE